MNSSVEHALRRHRAVTLSALLVLAILAWVWIYAGAGMGMDPLVSLAPFALVGGGAQHMAMGEAMQQAGAWPASRFALTFSMWWVMMVAMMLPSAAPTILLYARAADANTDRASPPSGSFLAGYLATWGMFSLAATILQMQLERISLLAPMQMAVESHVLSAGVLIAAGIYQLSPLKDACLNHCRSPAQFLSRNYRPGRLGALRMGALHGSYCVGCCWLLMALLFVGGVMNLVWIALLTLLVAAEKLLPFGRQVAIAAGLGCIALGVLALIG